MLDLSTGSRTPTSSNRRPRTRLLPQLRARSEAIDMRSCGPHPDDPRLAARSRAHALISIALVVILVVSFLRNVRPRSIPRRGAGVAASAPSASCTLSGYSLDNLSLMALTIATGFVVDDAIVVLENDLAHIEQGMRRSRPR
jgi:hypothetical protein